MESSFANGFCQARELREVALDFLITLGLNLSLVVLPALVLWPFGKVMLAVSFAKGYGVF